MVVEVEEKESPEDSADSHLDESEPQVRIGPGLCCVLLGRGRDSRRQNFALLYRPTEKYVRATFTLSPV